MPACLCEHKPSGLDFAMDFMRPTQSIATDSERKWFSTLLSDMHVSKKAHAGRLQLRSHSSLSSTLRGIGESSLHVLGRSESLGRSDIEWVKGDADASNEIDLPEKARNSIVSFADLPNDPDVVGVASKPQANKGLEVREFKETEHDATTQLRCVINGSPLPERGGVQRSTGRSELASNGMDGERSRHRSVSSDHDYVADPISPMSPSSPAHPGIPQDECL